MLVKQCHTPPMTGNGKHTTYKNGDDWGMVYYCFTNIIYIYILLCRLKTCTLTYCGWASKILHQLIDGKHPIMEISFQPSKVYWYLFNRGTLNKAQQAAAIYRWLGKTDLQRDPTASQLGSNSFNIIATDSKHHSSIFIRKKIIP